MSMAFYLVHQILVSEINSIWGALALTLLLSYIFTCYLNIDSLNMYILKLKRK